MTTKVLTIGEEGKRVRDLMKFRRLVIAHAALQYAHEELVWAQRCNANEQNTTTVNELRETIALLDGVVGRVEELEGDIARAQPMSREEWLDWMNRKWALTVSAGGKK